MQVQTNMGESAMVLERPELIPELGKEKPIGRYLGLAFLTVLVGSAVSGLMSKPIMDSPIEEALVSINEQATQMRWSAMIELFITSVGIVALAVLLYAAVRRYNPLMALVALGWWLAEAITLAVSTVAVFLLIPLSEAYVAAGATASPDLLALGDTLVGFDERAYDVHMAFFCLGGLIWYWLMYQSKVVPRWLSGFGLIVVALALVATVLILGAEIDWFLLAMPVAVFELTIGLWLVIKGLAPMQFDDRKRLANRI